MSPDVMKLGWEILVTICGLGGGIVGMWATLNFAKRQAVADDFAAVHRALQEEKNRVTKLETELSYMPRHSDLSELSASVNQMGQRVGTLEGRIDGIRSLLESIHDHLLNAQ